MNQPPNQPPKETQPHLFSPLTLKNRTPTFQNRIWVSPMCQYSATDGRPEVQKFMGALQGQGASGGVFITTSEFTREAEEYVAKNMSPRIILIDGFELGSLLVKHEVGVVALRSYKVLEIDENLFDESEK